MGHFILNHPVHTYINLFESDCYDLGPCSLVGFVRYKNVTYFTVFNNSDVSRMRFRVAVCVFITAAIVTFDPLLARLRNL